MGVRKNIKSEGGFTLIELMIASALFVIGIVGVLSSYTSSSTLRMSAEERTVIQARISSTMDEIYRIDDTDPAPLDLNNYTPPDFDGYPNMAMVVQFEDDTGTLVTPPLADTVELPNPLHVVLTTTVTFTSGREVVYVTETFARR